MGVILWKWNLGKGEGKSLIFLGWGVLFLEGVLKDCRGWDVLLVLWKWREGEGMGGWLWELGYGEVGDWEMLVLGKGVGVGVGFG